MRHLPISFDRNTVRIGKLVICRARGAIASNPRIDSCRTHYSRVVDDVVVAEFDAGGWQIRAPRRGRSDWQRVGAVAIAWRGAHIPADSRLTKRGREWRRRQREWERSGRPRTIGGQTVYQQQR